MKVTVLIKEFQSRCYVSSVISSFIALKIGWANITPAHNMANFKVKKVFKRTFSEKFLVPVHYGDGRALWG
jgi:hypothetical protein